MNLQCQTQLSTKMSQRIKFVLAITFFVLYNLSYTTFALRCYTCTYTEAEQDNACLLNPAGSVKITDCNKKYCTIVRQEAVSPAGKVISFIRDCQDNPLFLNAVKTDPTFKTYYRSCVMDLCNDSDGIKTATHIDPNFGAAENTVLRGIRSAAWRNYVTRLFIFKCPTLLIGYNRNFIL